MDSWLLVPCQRSRLPLLQRLLWSLSHPPDRVVVVATMPDPLTEDDVGDDVGHLLLCHRTEQHISRWWNQGMDYIRSISHGDHEILAVSSDYIGTPNSIPMLAEFLRDNQLAMVGPDHHTTEQRIFRHGDHRTVDARVPGACWMLAGESQLRVDESFRWWYSDDDLEMQARHRSGVGVLPGTGLVPGADSGLSEEKQAWAIEDRQKFATKWGIEPW